jgi:hypothetical protein
MSARDWSLFEVEATISSYLTMLTKELKGEIYNKTAHRHQLQNLLHDRSDAAIEKKHQNISAVLTELGIPYIRGYKPLYNYQRLLFDIVADSINNSKGIVDAIEIDFNTTINIPTVEDILTILEEPPKPSMVKEELAPYQTVTRKPVKINYLEKECRNQKLGNAGEEFVLRYEKARLIHHSKESLSDKIELVSSYNDAAGFDIRSFDIDGCDRFIEVKTTTCGKEFPFYLTHNEVTISKKLTEKYFLYRLFNFREKPGLYQLKGALTETCNMKPRTYVASVM